MLSQLNQPVVVFQAWPGTQIQSGCEGELFHKGEPLEYAHSSVDCGGGCTPADPFCLPPPNHTTSCVKPPRSCSVRSRRNKEQDANFPRICRFVHISSSCCAICLARHSFVHRPSFRSCDTVQSLPFVPPLSSTSSSQRLFYSFLGRTKLILGMLCSDTVPTMMRQ